MIKKASAAGNGSVPMALLTGVAASLGITLLGAAVAAWLIAAERIGEESADMAAWIIVFLSAGIGAWFASVKAGKKKLQLCLLMGAAYFLLLLCTTAMFFGGQYSGTLIGGILILAASGAAALIGMRRGTSGKRKSWKKAYR